MNIYLIVVACVMLYFYWNNRGTPRSYLRKEWVVMAYVVAVTNMVCLANGSAIIITELVKLLH